ncbi:2-octaprenyl-6-methoxyphenyl hydroxylase [Pseudomonas sp. NW5]|uniref:2-octaprenyl-6-methoxyphenyl hydroxylase n=1 Tax=Pseudomonas sp. NW5 TaxID=2934934 RepID=UPI0020202ADD|nr:2-octaprenyl-6-methoxyphenyl hydroxylase [Pseudomonas sp. NW5]MCL7462706.1 2-octaprenyl-6-methoxyphenyl hydroxylase [Pseudomonas sp. NW5]
MPTTQQAAGGHIVIAGGGLVGASLALALLEGGARARGWRISLVEPHAPGEGFQPSFDARSSALSWGSRQTYQRLGLWTAIAAQAEPITRIHVGEQGRAAATRLSAEEEGVPALGYVVDNAWLGHCLWQRLRAAEGLTWYCPARVERVQAVPGGYHLTLDDGSPLDCDLLVLADGGRSDLRTQLGIHVRRTEYGQSALIANIGLGQPHGGEAFERFTRHGPMALLPLAGQRSALVWTRSPEEIARLQALPDAAFLAELQQTFGYRLGRLRRVGTRYSYPLALHEAEEQVRSHLVVLGNAAHGLHPIAGQGFNLSLRDVMALSETLLGSAAPLGELATLQRYLQRQRDDQALTIGFSDRVTRLFSNAHPLLACGRSLGLLALELCAPARQAFARQAMGLGTRR